MYFLIAIGVGVILFTIYTNSVCRDDLMDDPDVRWMLANTTDPKEDQSAEV